jgi:hypothetical protein
MAMALGAGAACIGVVYLANRQLGDLPFQDLVRDPGHVIGASPWVGALAFVGWFGWTAAAVLLVTAAWLRRRAGRVDARAAFLIASGVLAVLAWADDAFQLHERVLVDATGVAERGWYVVWAAAVVAWVVAFRRQLARSPAELGLAAGLLGCSLAMDALPVVQDLVERLPGRPVSWEESVKLLGIGSFTAFAAREVGAAATVGFEDASRITTTAERSGVEMGGESWDEPRHAATRASDGTTEGHGRQGATTSLKAPSRSSSW